ncbi:conserved hypothetical protein [Syntrophobacter sp. SbD1]|nr:conserved hypothetical protein [Syntrophobacter sp. SbD1]
MATVPEFPFLPQWLITGKNAGIPCGMRPFGVSAEDLTVDFRLSRRPELITELLAKCFHDAEQEPVDRDLLLDMPVGMRIEALLELAALADPNPLSWQVRCSSGECMQESEFELAVEQIVSLNSEQRELQTVTACIGSVEALLRRPTGHDQIEWLKQPVESEFETMLSSILVRPSLEELLAKGVSVDSVSVAIDEVMDSFDPLLAFHVSVACPHCGFSSKVYPDLVGSALERLSRCQRVLIEDVHCLASRYHWSEREILDLPEWRRRTYLDLIEETVV